MNANTQTHPERETWNPLGSLDDQASNTVSAAADDPQAFLIFMLGGQWLATNVGQVREILDDQPITPLPKAPHDVEGMIDVRGNGVAMVDLSQHLGVHPMNTDKPRRVVVFEFSRDGRTPLPIGVRTEAVRDVCLIQQDMIEAAPDSMRDWDQSMIEGIARIDGEIVVVVNLAAVFGGSSSHRDDVFDFGQ